MTMQGWILIIAFVAILIALTKPIGLWLFALYEGRRTPLHAVLGPVERGFYKLAGIDPTAEQGWRRYAVHMLIFNAVLMLFSYAVLRLQAVLPLNALGYAGNSGHLAFNTAVSFTTNTNWQSYAGESTMSNLSQMLGLTIHNFLSAATGIALAFALFRGFARRQASSIGNFWADATRITLYLLLPLCFVYAIVLVANGVPQTLAGSVDIATLEGGRQTLALGPVASQEAIKMLGTNGGGFFNANSAHPFENPNALHQPAADAVDLRDRLRPDLVLRQGGRQHPPGLGDPLGDGHPVPRRHHDRLLAGSGRQPGAPRSRRRRRKYGGQGGPLRYRRIVAVLGGDHRGVVRCGQRDARQLHSLGGLIPLFNIQLGEVVVGGVGAGIYGFLLFAILAVFVAGLMVGRTPEYVGKKIESREVKLAVLAIAVLPLIILGFTAISSVLPAGLAGPLNKGPHGFSEILYAFTSAVGNNGSAFAGLTANTPYYNMMLGIAMWIGRFFIIVPMLAIAGSLAAKKHIPESTGSFPTTGGLWIGLLVGIILVVGGLTFLPGLALGPIADHLAMVKGVTF
jgi:K+-transporting ATPase ATPase A chain